MHDLKKIRKKAIRFAEARGYKEVAEDFAQEFLIQVISNRRTSIHNILSDFLSKEFGDHASVSGRQKAMDRRSYIQIDKLEKNIESVGSQRDRLNYRDQCLQYTDYFEHDSENGLISQIVAAQTGRTASILNGLISGVHQIDMAQKLNISESSVSMGLKEARIDVSRQIVEAVISKAEEIRKSISPYRKMMLESVLNSMEITGPAWAKMVSLHVDDESLMQRYFKVFWRYPRAYVARMAPERRNLPPGLQSVDPKDHMQTMCDIVRMLSPFDTETQKKILEASRLMLFPGTEGN